ncbi:uncharacterized protein DUF1876 [Halopolyspora algeriensis]|uniref:Uncharacterized protein DUF1876 n=1 Tax=Halopolyspora algeriensis TaxID=1500506 RepID=A0A368VHI6_9ACTN|nr:DUF1876 domain-containing protein [Halopolyspora algeriensis]RCW39790.1 uncharacterized protein DUF1876 [Halopolyspora algeriensis]TQM56445.1 uncharacterized protein DUF1876 [Halopolyspora algeriensis]
MDEQRMHDTRTLTLNMQVTESGMKTTADATMATGTGRVVHGHGMARRHPDDPDIPQIGDEIAAARALSELAHKLLDTAAQEIGERQHTRVRLPA